MENLFFISRAFFRTEFCQAQPMDAPKENAESLTERENEGILQGGIPSIVKGFAFGWEIEAKRCIITNVQLKNHCKFCTSGGLRKPPQRETLTQFT